MKILLSTYACEPNRGSEPGVGWKWALGLANDPNKEIYVLTRRNNKEVINQYWEKNVCPSNLHFYYYDLPLALVWAKHHGMPVNLYHAWWLLGSARYAKQLHMQYHFDMAHHLTFGVFRDPCALYKLDIPYVVGPVGGGEQTPSKLLALYSTKERIKESFRGIANKLAFLNPILHKSLNKASLILTKTEDTKRVLKKWEIKTIVNLEIGINGINVLEPPRDKHTFIFVGRFTYWKGVKLALLAFKQYSESYQDACLLMIGKGEMEGEIKKFALDNNLNIEIIPWIQQDELRKFYSTSCAMVFPSLHDSSGNVVLEALSFGLPVVCLDCGGPASILGESLKETVVSTKDNNIDVIVAGIKKKMEALSSDDGFYSTIQANAYERAKTLLWQSTVDSTYSLISQKLFAN